MLPRRVLSFVLVTGGVLSTCILWRYVDDTPLVWTAPAWVAVLATLYIRSRALEHRRLLSYAMALVAGIAFAEGTLWVLHYQAEQHVEDKFRGESFLSNGAPIDRMRTQFKDGAAPRFPPGVDFEHTKKLENDVIFDVHYTIDANGFRVGAPAGAKTAGCVLIFGDSMMFGWGANDRDTAAQQVNRLSGGSLAVYNFSIPSYSAHHMLAQIQQGIVKKIASCEAGKPVYVIEQILPVAVTETISVSFSRGPRYIISNGTPVRRGNLGEGEFIAHDTMYINPFMFSMLRKAQLYERTLGELRHDEFDTKRFLAIVAESKSSLERQFPRVKFMVTVWDDFLSSSSAMASQRRALVQALNQKGIDTHGIDEILPDYDRNPFKYCIAHEIHPTAEAHRFFAEYLVGHWISYPLGSSRQASHQRLASKL